IHHAKTRTGVQRYKVEPYVMVADIYAEPTHVGRGGWTWYTGSAGWMYRAGIESILGIHLHATTLTTAPTIPRAWPGSALTTRAPGPATRSPSATTPPSTRSPSRTRTAPCGELQKRRSTDRRCR